MTRPLATRILLGLATLLFVSGCALGAAGLHPAINKPPLSRLGILLAMASLPPWMLVVAEQSRQLTESQLRDAHLSGYETCLDQLREFPELRQQLLYRVPSQATRTLNGRKRGL